MVLYLWEPCALPAPGETVKPNLSQSPEVEYFHLALVVTDTLTVVACSPKVNCCFESISDGTGAACRTMMGSE